MTLDENPFAHRALQHCGEGAETGFWIQDFGFLA